MDETEIKHTTEHMIERYPVESWPELQQKYATEQTTEMWHRTWQIGELLRTAGAETYAAGGFVRDILLGKAPKDIDLATSLEPDKVQQVLETAFTEEIKTKKVSLQFTGSRFGVLRVGGSVEGQRWEVEVASFRQDQGSEDGRRPASVKFGGTLQTDAERRDFTINALYYNLSSGEILDAVGGMQDIQDKQVRFVGNPKERIQEDFLRMQRFARMIIKTGFVPEAESLKLVREMSGLLLELPPEALRMELEKAAVDSSPKFSQVLMEYERCGILDKVLPEVAKLRECAQGPLYHMEGDVLVHTGMVADGLPANSSFALVMTAYLHDIGKPDTKEIVALPDGGHKVTFHRHEKVGAEMARPITERLRFSNAEQHRMNWLIENHLAPFNMGKMRSFASLVKLVNNPYFADLARLALADIAGSTPVDPKLLEANHATTRAIKEKFLEVRKFFDDHNAELLEIDKQVLSGHTIIARYQDLVGQRPPDPLIGKIKAQASNILRDQKIVSVDKAFVELDRVIKQMKPKP